METPSSLQKYTGRTLRARLEGGKCIVLLQETYEPTEALLGVPSYRIGLRVVGYETPPTRVRKPKG